jgi:hypothetical protein
VKREPVEHALSNKKRKKYKRYSFCTLLFLYFIDRLWL